MIGVSPERLQQLAGQLDIDNDDVQEALLRVVEDKATPRLEEIRERARDAEDPDAVREQIESLPDDDKNRLFHDTWAELIAACVQLRIEPIEGMVNLKQMIRDPWTVEAMLLLFEDEQIPGEIVGANKDLMADYMNWIGIALAPEMYERAEVERMVETFGSDPALLDKWTEIDDDE